MHAKYFKDIEQIAQIYEESPCVDKKKPQWQT